MPRLVITRIRVDEDVCVNEFNAHGHLIAGPGDSSLKTNFRSVSHAFNQPLPRLFRATLGYRPTIVLIESVNRLEHRAVSAKLHKSGTGGESASGRLRVTFVVTLT